MEIIFSSHALDMLNERNIAKELALDTVCSPDSTRLREDGTVHYYKTINEKTLHIVINPKDNKVITLFYDRRGIRESED